MIFMHVIVDRSCHKAWLGENLRAGRRSGSETTQYAHGVAPYYGTYYERRRQDRRMDVGILVWQIEGFFSAFTAFWPSAPGRSAHLDYLSCYPHYHIGGAEGFEAGRH